VELSKKRAKSAVDYMISKGIPKTKLISKGYGETKPLNHCGNDVKCSDEEYQINRRTEFTILDI
jgi:outer membrane protein OmpA-like peptidoglycan-associated protein